MSIRKKLQRCTSMVLTLAMVLSMVMVGNIFTVPAEAASNPVAIPAGWQAQYATATALGYDPNTTAAGTYTDVDIDGETGSYTINTTGAYRFFSSSGVQHTNLRIIVDGSVGNAKSTVEADIILDNISINNVAAPSSSALGIYERGSGSDGLSSPLIVADGAKAWVTLVGNNHLQSSVYSNTTINPGVAITVSSSIIFTERSGAGGSGSGSVYIEGARCSAGMGGWHDSKSGFIMINGGNVTAATKGDNAYSGIGGGHYNGTDGSWCPGIVITGGNVKAYGGHVGIGGWFGHATASTTNYIPGAFTTGQPSFILITGGTVLAENSSANGMAGFNHGAAVGFVLDNATTPVHITGGDVTAIQNGYGAGIGGSATISGTNTSTKVTVDMTNSMGTGAGIGGGGLDSNINPAKGGQYGAAAGDMLIAGGTINITAKANGYGAGIGGGGGIAGAGNGGNIDITGGDITISGSQYGAAIGGGGTIAATGGGSGGDVVISGGDFTLVSGTYGAGIGGGGTDNTSATATGGNGGNVQITNGTFKIFTGTYGAGMGGGGSLSRNGGNGGNVTIDGGQFAIYSGTYGAGFGGGGTQGGTGGTGGKVVINDGDFEVYSGTYGAGMGGGGSHNGNGGNGGGAGDTFTVNGGEFSIATGLTSYGSTTAPVPVFSNGNVNTDYSFGAGIGGGGSATGTAGNGMSAFLATGGYFSSTSHGYGAGIGGGGAAGAGAGGAGGTSEYQGGTVVVSYPGFVGNQHTTGVGSIGMGGGASVGGTNRTHDGTVTITGGNIATQIVSQVDPLNNPTWTSWTKPYPAGLGGPPTGTQSAVRVTTGNSQPVIAAGEVGEEVFKVGYRYFDRTPGGLGNTNFYDYGVKDMFVTQDTSGDPELWIWVPSAFFLDYDLTTGSVDVPSGFALADAHRDATGTLTVQFASPNRQYTVNGETKTLLTWNQSMDATAVYDGATWAQMNSTSPAYQAGGVDFYQVVDHPNAMLAGVSTPVEFVGWTTAANLAGLADPSMGGANHIFALNDGWDYTNFAVDTVTYATDDIVVYAMWGFDVDGNGIADVLEGAATLVYAGNGSDGGTVPTNSMSYSVGDDARVSPPATMTKTGKVFVGWTENVLADLPDTANWTAVTATDAVYISAVAPNTTGTITFSNGSSVTGSAEYHFATGGAITLNALWADDVNGNGIPDFLETPVKLIHNTAPAILTIPAVADIPYLPGQTGTSADGSSVGLNLTANNTNGYIFIGWTEDATAVKVLTSAHTVANEPADLADPITLAAAFGSADKTVYGVWAEDLNGNTVPDYKESGLNLVFNVNTSDTVTGVPIDTNSYFMGDSVNVTSDDLLTKADSLMNPYMERTGWALLGWVSVDPAGSTDHTTAPAPATYTYLHKTTNPVSALTFTTSTNSVNVYAVWGVDSNNNGVPDWDDRDGRTASYMPILATGDYNATSMPFYNSGTPTSFVDPGPSTTSNFNNYTSDETVAVSSQVPTAAGYVFLGWSPMFNHGNIFGAAPYGIEEFYEHLALLEEILMGRDTGVGNNVSYNDPITGAVTPGTYATDIEYTLNAGLRANYDAYYNYRTVLGYSKVQALQAAYGGFNWTTYAGEGFLDTVTFDAFNQGMYDTVQKVGPAPGTIDLNDPYCMQWQLYAVWGVDINNNGIADMFENAHNLIYKIDTDAPLTYQAATGGPNSSSHHAGATVALDPCTTTIIGKQDNLGTSMIFLGWTPDNTVRECYGVGDITILPTFASSVTFGDFDITVYAVWGIDANQNNIPDVYENSQYTLTYDPNGGNAGTVPVDGNNYNYGDVTTVNTAVIPTHPTTSHIFLYWTDDATVAPDYGFGDRPNLPAEITSVTFNTAVTNVKLYAVWGEDTNGNGIADVLETSYTLAYDANGGNASSVPVDATAYNWGDTATVSATAATHSTYVFVGWTDAAPTTFSSVYYAGQQAMLPNLPANVTFSSTDIDLYAVWSTDYNNNGTPDVYENGYTITYDANGGTGAPTVSNPYPTGADVVVPAQGAMTNPGNSFVSWNDLANGSGTNYAPGSLYTVGAGNVTLYAQWTVSNTVTYDANGGTGGFVSVVPGTTHTVLAQAATGISRASYTFLGWNDAANGTGTSYAPGASLTVAGNVTLYAQWKSTGGSSGGSGGGSDNTVTYRGNGGTGSKTVQVSKGDTHNILSAGNAGVSYEGYKFISWNTKASGDGTSYLPGDTITVSSSITLYAQWEKDKGVIGATLNTKDHIVYLNGYPDGGVHPDGNITRAEAANIFFRLLDPVAHSDRNDPVRNQFTDINSGDWHAQGINYLAEHGIISGYADGTFRPDTPITRAELATIAARFDELSYTDSSIFSDVPDSHWAVAYVNSASIKGWVTGYAGGTFEPEQFITRGETVTLVNRMLSRAIDAAALATVTNPYNDIATDHWAYAAIIEASIAHDFDRDANSVEIWK